MAKKMTDSDRKEMEDFIKTFQFSDDQNEKISSQVRNLFI
jgi:hypothetical protein